MRSRSVIVALILSFIFISSYGQTSRLEVGVVVAPSVSHLWGNTVVNKEDPIAAVAGGFSFRYDLQNRYSLVWNILYEQKGVSNTSTIIGNLDPGASSSIVFGTQTVRANFNYVTLPVMLRRLVGRSNRFFLDAGPYFGYLINEVDVVSGVGSGRVDRTSSVKKLDVGISMGVGMRIPVNNQFTFSAEIRDNLGLVNVSKQSLANGSLNTNSTNLIFGLSCKVDALRRKRPATN